MEIQPIMPAYYPPWNQQQKHLKMDGIRRLVIGFMGGYGQKSSKNPYEIRAHHSLAVRISKWNSGNDPVN